jgi:uroporphyrinogen-III synthase
MYNDNGNFNPNISTKTVDEFLKAIENKKIVLEMDKDVASISPRLKKGAMQQGFENFLRLKPLEEVQPRRVLAATM